jgi:hypothetical protein
MRVGGCGIGSTGSEGGFNPDPECRLFWSAAGGTNTGGSAGTTASGTGSVYMNMKKYLFIWNGKYTGWEDLGNAHIPLGEYLDSEYILEGAAEGVLSIYVTRYQGSTIILERSSDDAGDYWWWTENGTVQFFQDVYVVR